MDEVTDERHPYLSPRISPDGRRVVMTLFQDNHDLWMYDTARNNFTRLTFDDGMESRPIWTPNGERITYISVRGDQYAIRWMAASGAGDNEILVTRPEPSLPMSWSPDGKALAINEQHTATGWDVFMFRLDEQKAVEPLLQSPFDERHPTFSPDGRWIAYTSNESGRDEVYVQSYPERGTKVTVSVGGGAQPVWSPDGAELFYRVGNQFVSVPVSRGIPMSVGEPGRPLRGAV